MEFVMKLKNPQRDSQIWLQAAGNLKWKVQNQS